MVLKELIFNSFYFRQAVVVLKELILNSFYFGRLCGLERTDFEQFLQGVVTFLTVEVLKELILNS